MDTVSILNVNGTGYEVADASARQSVLDISAKLASLDGTTLASSVQVNYSSISALNTTIGQHTTSISSLDTTVGKHTTSISGLSTTVGRHTTSLSSLSTTVGLHTTTITSLSTTVGRYTTSISTLSTSIVSIQTEVESLADDTLPENLQLCEDIDAVESTLVDSIGYNLYAPGPPCTTNLSTLGYVIDDSVPQLYVIQKATYTSSAATNNLAYFRANPSTSYNADYIRLTPVNKQTALTPATGDYFRYCRQLYRVTGTNGELERVNSSNAAATKQMPVATQAMLSESDKVYRIKYDYNLQGADIQLGKNVTLEFCGGSFFNGHIKSDNHTTKIVNPPTIVDGENDMVYMGRFFDSAGRELTYKMEPIDRSFTMIGNVYGGKGVGGFMNKIPTNGSQFFFQMRRMGITQYNGWIMGWDDTSILDNLIGEIKYFNGYMYCMKSTYPVSDSTTDKLTISEWEDAFKLRVNRLIDEVGIDNLNYIGLDNENNRHFNSDEHIAAFQEMSEWLRSVGLKSQISHWTPIVDSPLVSSENKRGFGDGFDSDHFDNVGYDQYPTAAIANLPDYDYRGFDFKRMENAWEDMVKRCVKATEHRGFHQFSLSETGFGQHINSGYGVDVGGTLDENSSVQIAMWREWLSILSKYADRIEYICCWVQSYTEVGTSVLYKMFKNY